jgi:C-methyltransferase C-terminal domain/Putative zinc binding domain/Methyltransferase domain
VAERTCRACRSRSGSVVLDLGSQPACDYFPPEDSLSPDPVYPLQLWFCSACKLAQLADDPTVPQEAKGIEPVALVLQAADAVRRVADAGLARPGARVAEYGSPHGGSWLGLLAGRGLRPVTDGPADVVVDCFGLMHAADQAAALAERTARVAPGGVLLLQYHSLETIARTGQWNALRHGHYAYYSTTAIGAMLAAAGFRPRTAWWFPLYGGTVLLAAERASDSPGEPGTGQPDDVVRDLLGAEDAAGLRGPDGLRGLQQAAAGHAGRLRDWLAAARSAGLVVAGYGAASRAVALLKLAGVDRDLLGAIADASPAKRGTRMPGTSIPVISPGELIRRRPDTVLVFVSDLVPEVRASYPEIEANGGHWVSADSLSVATSGP